MLIYYFLELGVNIVYLLQDNSSTWKKDSPSNVYANCNCSYPKAAEFRGAIQGDIELETEINQLIDTKDRREKEVKNAPALHILYRSQEKK